MTGIVVVTWNSGGVVAGCLDACLSLPDVEVVVVDNASADSTVEIVRSRPRVRLIANRENRGFAAAANQGISALDHPAVLLLNPDAMPVTGIESLAEAVRDPSIGAAAGRLLDLRGQPQDGFNVRGFPGPWTLAFEAMGVNRVFPWNPVNRRYRQTLRAAADVDQPAGAFLMVNRAAWCAIGGLDESFWPAWFEDVDFCLRLRRAGYRVRYVPDASACHLGGHSASALSWESRQLFWYDSLLRFSAIHLSAVGRRIVTTAVMAACLPRGLFALAGPGGLAAVGVYSRVFWLAFGCWRRGDRLSGMGTGSLQRKEKLASRNSG